MTASELFAIWLKRIAAHAIIVGSAPDDEAVENTTVFSVEDARMAGAAAPELADFLIKAFRAYSVQAAKIGLHGWFYAWSDEMSGTIRCSVSTVSTPGGLPFSCTLDIHDDPVAIAETALKSPYSSGIPSAELEPVDWTDMHSCEPPLVLPVFVRRVIH